MTKIIRERLNHGLLEPLFGETTGSLVLTFRKYVITEETLKELKEERIIVGYIKEYDKISRQECVELLKISPTTVFRYLKALERKDIMKKRKREKCCLYINMNETNMKRLNQNIIAKEF